jgi:UDP-glucose 4-epimerase
MSSTYLVTGGAGFIGSHVSEQLLTRGDRVVVVDNLSTGRLSNLDACGTNRNFRFVQGSVLDELLVDELVHECDVVIHLAAAVGVRLIVEQPLRSFITNIRGGEIIFEAAHRYRRTILLASTSEIYGKNNADSLDEDSDRFLGSPGVARWAYSTSKAVDEVLAHAYHKERGLPMVIARFFNTVGPRQSPAYGMVIPTMIRQAVRGEPITVHGTGEQTRCFCHVDDVVRAVIALLDHPDALGGTYNVGRAEEISILALARLIVDRTQSDSEILLVPYDVAYESGFEDMMRRVPDATRLQRLTGWSPTKSLNDILAEMILEAQAEQVTLTARR